MKPIARWTIGCLAAAAFVAPLKFGTPVVAPLKFGTPVVLQSLFIPPDNAFDWIFFSWPNQLAVMLGLAALVWFLADADRLPVRADALWVLPVALLWTQVLAASGAINPRVATDTLLHFAVCVVAFYAAAAYVRDGAAAGRIFGGLALATFLICVWALDQRFGWLFGGLEEVARQADVYGDAAAGLTEVQERAASGRVFGSFVYPNTLAGFLAVAFVPSLAWIWSRGRSWHRNVRWTTLVLAAGLMFYCLLATRSRGGFLALAAALCVAAWHLTGGAKGTRRWTRPVATLVVLAGIFAVAMQANLLHLGRHSVHTRLDYWRGAALIARDHPVRGTGPGTFGSIFPRYKAEGSEPTRAAHNNFLQMAADSGLPGFLVFGALWWVALAHAWRLARQRSGDAAALAACAGLTGWVVHGLVDFDLYVPGVALPAFIMAGLVHGLKEPPEVSVEPRLKLPRPALAGLCGVVVAGVWWCESIRLAANLAAGQARLLAAVDSRAAYDAAKRAAALSPRDAEYLGLAGDFAWLLRHEEQAMQYYAAAVAADPMRASRHWVLAQAYAYRLLRSGTVDSAELEAYLAHARRAAELHPTHLEYQWQPQREPARDAESIAHPPDGLVDSLPARDSDE
jgi:hypothetical protein